MSGPRCHSYLSMGSNPCLKRIGGNGRSPVSRVFRKTCAMTVTGPLKGCTWRTR